MDDIKKLKKDNEITEDEQKDGEKKLQDITDDFVKQADSITKKKMCIRDRYYDYKTTATCTKAGIETKTCKVEGCNKVEVKAVPSTCLLYTSRCV